MYFNLYLVRNDLIISAVDLYRNYIYYVIRNINEFCCVRLRSLYLCFEGGLILKLLLIFRFWMIKF
jgi:hypothetical protein